MKKALLIVGSLILVAIAGTGIYFWNGFKQFFTVEVVKVDPQLTVYLGGGGNSIVLTSEDGSKALIVDTKMRDAAVNMKDAVKAGDITIVNTHSHSDHTAGNSLYPKAKIIAGAYTKEQWDTDSDKSRFPDIILKTGEEKEIKIGSETARIRNMGRAHTMNDVLVYLVNRKLLVTGDLVFLDMHPAVKTSSNSNVALWVKALDDLKDRFVIKKLVPGHGKISDASALAVMKEYFVSISEAIGNKDKLKELKKKYEGYYSLPAMTSYSKTVEFIEEEKKGSAK